MHKIPFMSLLLLPLFARCQYSDTAQIHTMEKRMHWSGLEFMAYKNQVVVGDFLIVIGAAGAIGGAASDAASNKGLIYAASAISLLGVIVNMAAIIHIGRAGIILRGNGLIIPIGKK